MRVKEVLRERAALLVVDRAELCFPPVLAAGLVLSPQGYPTVTARQMLTADGGSLVGRAVDSSADAVAASKDGANFVILQVQPGGVGWGVGLRFGNLGVCRAGVWGRGGGG